MASLRIVLRHRRALAAVLHASVLASVVTVFGACRSNSGSYDAFNQADCLPAITLIDQNGRNVTLSSLRGNPVVIDFIYTRCPGPCLLLTQKMARIATRLSSRIGSSFTMVSITVDPEHDAPDQMAEYMKAQGIEAKGWFFLTGPPARIDRVLTDFQLRRQRDPDGSVEHISGVFILGRDGREVREYDGGIVKATTVINDLQQVMASPRGKTS
jgi:protein SCO1/2